MTTISIKEARVRRAVRKVAEAWQKYQAARNGNGLAYIHARQLDVLVEDLKQEVGIVSEKENT